MDKQQQTTRIDERHLPIIYLFGALILIAILSAAIIIVIFDQQKQTETILAGIETQARKMTTNHARRQVHEMITLVDLMRQASAEQTRQQVIANIETIARLNSTELNDEHRRLLIKQLAEHPKGCRYWVFDNLGQLLDANVKTNDPNQIWQHVPVADMTTNNTIVAEQNALGTYLVTRHAPNRTYVVAYLPQSSIQYHAQQQVLAVLRQFQPDANGQYLFVYDLLDPNGGDQFARMLVNPNRPDLIGHVISSTVKDVNGYPYRQAFLDQINQHGNATVTYAYRHPTTSKIDSKTSYFQIDPKWHWIFAKGIYQDQVEQLIQTNYDQVHRIASNWMFWSAILISIALVLSILITWAITILTRSIVNQHRQREQFKHEAYETQLHARQNAELSLQQTTRQFRLAAQAAQIGPWLWDIQTDKFTDLDQWLSQRQCVEPNQTMTFKQFKRAIHPTRLRTVEQQIQQHLDGQTEHFDCRFRIQKLNGDWIWIKISGQIVEQADPQPRICAGIFMEAEPSDDPS